MARIDPAALQQFKSEVALKFQLYNSLFTSLPFHRIEKTGIMLSVLLNVCEEGYKKKKSPLQILDDFLPVTPVSEQNRKKLIYSFVSYNMWKDKWCSLMHWKMLHSVR